MQTLIENSAVGALPSLIADAAGEPHAIPAIEPGASPRQVARSHARAVLRTVWVTMGLNVANGVLKIIVGLWTGNLTVISDAMHGFLDAANNGVGIAALKASWLPPDENHPYGHRKYEALAALAVGGLMTLTAWEILRAVFVRLRSGAPSEGHGVSASMVALIIIGLVINFATAAYERRRGTQLKSQFLMADAAHTGTDAFVTLCGLASLFVAHRLPWVDPLLSLVVVGIILHAGWGVIRENALLLTDAAQLDPEPIKEIVDRIPDVIDSHAIRTHGMPDEIHLDLHIVVAPTLTAAETQRIESQVRGALQHAFPEIKEVAIHHQTERPRGEAKAAVSAPL